MRILLLLAAGSVLSAQPPNSPPPLDPNDPEGLVVSPNPSIRYAWKRKVFWKTSVGGSPVPVGRVPAQTAAERRQMTAVLDSLVALFRATPTGAAGEGFWVLDSRIYDYPDPFDLPNNVALHRFPLEYSTGMFPFYHEDIRSANGQWRLSVNGETQSVYFYYNHHPQSVRQPVIAAEDRGPDLRPVEFYLRPRVTGRMGGLPLYENDVLVAARAGRELWTPAPLGRVLKAALPRYEQDRRTAEERLAGLKKTNDEIQSAAWEKDFRDRFEKNNGALRTTRPSNYEARRNSMERELVYLRQKAAAEANPARDDKGAWYWNPLDAHAEAARRLAALTPAEASRPACFAEVTASPQKEGRYQMRGEILAAGTAPDCRELVMTNWDYFDLNLPRSAPQLLTVDSFGRCAKFEDGRLVSAPLRYTNAPPQGCYRHVAMWQELDWARFAATVQP